MSESTSKKAEIAAWAVACIVAFAVGYMVGWAQLEQARSHVRNLTAENEKLRAESAAQRERSERLETPERFDIAANERQALASLRTIVTAAAVYFANEEKGYPASLAALGPDGARILDSALAAGRKGGYVFRYTSVREGEMYTSFRLTARPERYGQTGRRSFYCDDSGAVRFTLEEREATAADQTM